METIQTGLIGRCDPALRLAFVGPDDSIGVLRCCPWQIMVRTLEFVTPGTTERRNLIYVILPVSLKWESSHLSEHTR